MVVETLHSEQGAIPPRPWYRIPFRLRRDFWQQECTAELWRGNTYISVTGQPEAVGRLTYFLVKGLWFGGKR